MPEVSIFDCTGLHQGEAEMSMPDMLDIRSSSSIIPNNCEMSAGREELSVGLCKENQKVDVTDQGLCSDVSADLTEASSSPSEPSPESSSTLNDLPEVHAVPEDSHCAEVVAEVIDIVPIDDEDETDEESCEVSDNKCKQQESQDEQRDEQRQQPWQPAIRSIAIRKRNKDDLLGVSFIQDSSGRLQIAKLNPKGLLADAPLQSGDNVLSINNDSDCACWSPAQAIRHLKDLVGLLSIVVASPSTDHNKVDPSLKQATVFKDDPQDKLGLKFKSEHGRLRIKSLNELDGGGLLAAGSALEVGDVVLSINGIQSLELDSDLARDIAVSAPKVLTFVVAETGLTPSLPAKVLEQCPSTSTELSDCFSPPSPIVASEVPVSANGDCVNNESGSEYHDSTSPAFISATVVKPSRQSQLGIQLGISVDGKIYIRKIARDGLLGPTPLAEGYVLLSINHNSCRKSQLKDVINYLRKAEGPLHLVARNPKGNSNIVQAMATKQLLDHPRARIGVAFSVCTFGTELQIGSIKSTSLFANSVLNKGDVAVKINGIPCRNLTPSDAVDLVKQTSGHTTITVETGSMSGIVLSHGPDSI